MTEATYYRYRCGVCEDTGTVEVYLDDDRLPARGPCHNCREWCPICKDYKPRTGHTCKRVGGNPQKA